MTEGDRRFLCKKTGTARQPFVYRQTVKYLASDVPRRSLLVMLWISEKADHPPTPSFDDYKLASIAGGGAIEFANTATSENCLGLIEVEIEKLMSAQLVVGWYKLFTPKTYQEENDVN